MDGDSRVDQRRVTRETLGVASIDDYESDVFHIWEGVDSGRSLLDIWSRVVEHTSRLAEGLRRGQYDRVQIELAGVAVWIMTFTGQARRAAVRQGADHLVRVRSALSDMIWFKYPGVCPVCQHPECTCLASLKAVETRHEILGDRAAKKKQRDQVRSIAQAKLNKKVVSLDDLQSMFERIYYSNILAVPIESIGFHLFEEIGEVTAAITGMYTFSSAGPDCAEYNEKLLDLEEELADVMSWMFSLSVKLKMVFASFDNYVNVRYSHIPLHIEPDIKLSSAILHKYCDEAKGGKLFCKMHCKTQPNCTCSVYVFNAADRASALAQKLEL